MILQMSIKWHTLINSVTDYPFKNTIFVLICGYRSLCQTICLVFSCWGWVWGWNYKQRAEDRRLVREMEREASWSLCEANKSVCMQHLSVFLQTLTNAPLDWIQTHPWLTRRSLKTLFIFIDRSVKSHYVRINLSVGPEKRDPLKSNRKTYLKNFQV